MTAVDPPLDYGGNEEVKLPARPRDPALTNGHAIATSEGSGRSSLRATQELSNVQKGPLTVTNAPFRESAGGPLPREAREPTLGSYVRHFKEQSNRW